MNDFLAIFMVIQWANEIMEIILSGIWRFSVLGEDISYYLHSRLHADALMHWIQIIPQDIPEYQ